MKKILLISVLIFLGNYLFSQDLHFSQYNQTPSLVNPALTGASSVFRASVIYKDQWRSVTVPYKTYGASIELKFKASNWEKNQPYTLTRFYKKSFSRLAGGLSFYSDKAGDGNMGSNQVNLSLATFIPINKNTSLSAGLQASVVQRQVDFAKLSFPNQYNGLGGYNNTINSGENYSSQNFIYPDFAGGVLWSYGFNEKSIAANNELKASLGAAMFHINQPKQKYLEVTNERLNAKYVIHGDFLIGIRNTNVAFAPSFMASFQGPSTEILAGTLIKYYFKDDSKYTGFIKRSAFSIGGFYRNRDAMILSAMIEYEQYAIGFSYDLNTSKLTNASTGRGGPEIFIRFVTPNPFLFQTNRAKFN
jgi:type IX secretion system PorP/SprF family membrane protein